MASNRRGAQSQLFATFQGLVILGGSAAPHVQNGGTPQYVISQSRGVIEPSEYHSPKLSSGYRYGTELLEAYIADHLTQHLTDQIF
jgi:hypothetical protein